MVHFVGAGSGAKDLITVRGAKNFVSKAMVAALLGSTPSTLRNVPQIRDVAVVSSVRSDGSETTLESFERPHPNVKNADKIKAENA